MEDYIRKVHYYETDKMGITHHSNYIKWLEEARIFLLDQAGFGYAKLEKLGIMSPVLEIQCQYKHSTTFDDTVKINVDFESFDGVKLVVKYTVTNLETGVLVLTATSTHCFVDANGKPILLKKHCPEFEKLLKNQII